MAGGRAPGGVEGQRPKNSSDFTSGYIVENRILEGVMIKLTKTFSFGNH